MGSPSRRATPNCPFPADQSRPRSRWAPPAEEGRLITRIKTCLLFKRGTPGRRGVPLKRSDAPAKAERRPHSKKNRGALTADRRPNKKEKPHNKKWVPLAEKGRPRQRRGPSRRKEPPAGDGRPSEGGRPSRREEPPAGEGRPQQKRGAPAEERRHSKS